MKLKKLNGECCFLFEQVLPALRLQLRKSFLNQNRLLETTKPAFHPKKWKLASALKSEIFKLSETQATG